MTTSYYSVSLDLAGKSCLVVGGGKVAERKVISLLQSNAEITVISPRVTDYLGELIKNKRIFYFEREYQTEDLAGVFLVISATDSKDANRKVAKDCLEKNILINAVDDPEYCNFIVPAVVRRGDLTISVSTGGKSPALARKIREELEKQYGDEYGPLLKKLGEIRKQILNNIPEQEKREIIFNCLADSELAELIKSGQKEKFEERIEKCLSLSLD